jgi:REP element-mobilizing transposase RayT
MSNHVHLIAAAKEGSNLSDTIRDLKKYQQESTIRTIKNTSFGNRTTDLFS